MTYTAETRLHVITFRISCYNTWETILLNDLPEHPPPCSLLCTVSLWSFTVRRPGMDSEMDIEFSPLEIFDEKEAETSNKHSVWMVCKIDIKYDLWRWAPTSRPRCPRKPVLMSVSYCLIFIGPPIIHILSVSLYFSLLSFKQRRRIYKGLETFDFHPLMFLSYQLNQTFRKMAASCTLREWFLS